MFQNQLVKSAEHVNFTHDDLISGRVPGIATIREEKTDPTSTNMMTVIELGADIRAKIFVTFLQFLYTGIGAQFYQQSTVLILNLPPPSSLAVAKSRKFDIVVLAVLTDVIMVTAVLLIKYAACDFPSPTGC